MITEIQPVYTTRNVMQNGRFYPEFTLSVYYNGPQEAWKINSPVKIPGTMGSHETRDRAVSAARKVGDYLENFIVDPNGRGNAA